jgi:hypothetical protein
MIKALVLLVFLLRYVVSFASDQVGTTVLNHTPRYLHVVINNKPFLYVAPGSSVETESGLTAFVEVFYSPGQGISGRAQKELTSTVTEEHSGSADCSNNRSNGCDDETSSSRSASPLLWDVTPSDLSPE